jgi:hypothetical protein
MGREPGSSSRAIFLITLLVASTAMIGFSGFSEHSSAPSGLTTQSSPITHIGWIGYDGNSSIYATEDTNPYAIPSQNTSVFQAANAGESGTSNSLAVQTYTNGGTPSTSSAFQDTGNSQFSIWLALGAAGTSTSYWFTSTYYGTGAVAIWAAIPSGLPTGTVATWEQGSYYNSGVNVSKTGQDAGSTTIYDMIQGAFSVAADLAIETDGVSLAVDGAMTLLNIASDMSTSGFTPVTSVTPGSSLVQWSLVTNGVTTTCNASQGTMTCPNGEGTNNYAVGNVVDVTIPNNVLSQVPYSQQIILTASQDEGSSTSLGGYIAGAATGSVVYNIDPAVSIGGTAYLYQGGPPATNAQITLTQGCPTSGVPYPGTTYYVINTNSNNGNWHFFADPACSYAYGLTATTTMAPYTLTSSGGITLGAEGSWNPNIALYAAGAQVNFVATPTSPACSGSWAVTFNGVNEGSSTNTISFIEQPGTYQYTVTTVPAGCSASPSTDPITVPSSNSVNQGISISPIPYSVTFTETGLPSGDSWSVTLAGARGSSSGSTISFTESDGTYSYTVTAPAGNVASPASGSVTVDGSSVNVPIALSFPYTVTFTESGLPSGTSWSATLGGTQHSSSTSTITLSETNGTYSFSIQPPTGFKATPSSGTITVNGENVEQSVVFTSVPTYTVTFTASGLPTGGSWSVTLGTTLHTTSTSTITFTESNGTYSFTVTAPSGYTATPASGSVKVNGSAVNQKVTLAKKPVTGYSVTFSETGLISGTKWCVTLSGSQKCSTGASIGFSEPDGSYSFSVGGVSGYTVNPGSGTVTVSNGSVSKTITFKVQTCGCTV